MWSSWTSVDKTQLLENIVFSLSSFVSFKGKCVFPLCETPTYLLIMKFSSAVAVTHFGVCHTWSFTHTDTNKEDAVIYISSYLLNVYLIFGWFGWFTMLYYLQMYSNVIQLYTHILFFRFFSIGHYCEILSIVSCVIQSGSCLCMSISGFPWWLSGKESTSSARATGDGGAIPGSGRSPGGGRGNPLQYSCLENPMDREAWQAMLHRVAKDMTEAI